MSISLEGAIIKSLTIFGFFLLGMAHRPVKIHKETKRRKYLKMAEKVVNRQHPFPVMPLSEEEKALIRKKYHVQEIGLWVGLVLLSILSFPADNGIRGEATAYYYIITYGFQFICTFIYIRYTYKKYRILDEEIEGMGKLRSKIIHRYDRHPYIIWGYLYRRRFRPIMHFRQHIVISVYVDEKQEIHCLKGRSDILCNDRFGYIDALIYKGKFAGYGADEYIR